MTALTISPRTRLSRSAVALALALAAGGAPMLSACATKSSATYNPTEAGLTMRVERARVVSSREVVIEGLKGDNPGWGTLIGATVAGAATYGLTEADTPLGVAVTIIAAIGGALAGTFAEEQTNRHPGTEYILRPEDGGKDFGVVQVQQGGETALPTGSEVVVLYGRGNFVRVVPDELAPNAGKTTAQPATAPQGAAQ